MSAWSPGRVASFGAGEWVVMVTDDGRVRIWRSPDVAFSMLEVSAFDLRRALGERGLSPSRQRGSWTVDTTELGVSCAYRKHIPSEPDPLFLTTESSASLLREGLGRALDAIHRYHHPESTLADFEAKWAQEHGGAP